MIASGIALLRGISPRSWLFLGLLAALAGVGGYCSIHATLRERGRVEVAVAQTNLKAERRNSAAYAAAANERLTDERSITAHERKLTDAVSPLPDAHPSHRRRALACQRLRNDPRADPEAVTARCGSGG